MEPSTPWISVVITAHNRPGLLRQAIASVLDQTFHNIEIIVIDDGSPTPLEPVTLGFDFPIIYLRHQHRMGANCARNTGVCLASGHYIACLDDDDVWLPSKLELQLQAIGNTNACLCGYEFFDSGEAHVYSVPAITAEMLKVGNSICGMSGLLCKRDWLLMHPFDEALQSGQDWDTFVRLAQESPIPYVPHPLFRYRRGQHTSITTQVKQIPAAEFQRRLAVAHKHHDWMGEYHYRRRVARTILAYIGERPQRLQLIWYALLESGPQATASVLLEKLGNFFRRGGAMTTH